MERQQLLCFNTWGFFPLGSGWHDVIASCYEIWYALFLLILQAGLIVWNVVEQCLNKTEWKIMCNDNYLKRTDAYHGQSKQLAFIYVLLIFGTTPRFPGGQSCCFPQRILDIIISPPYLVSIKLRKFVVKTVFFLSKNLSFQFNWCWCCAQSCWTSTLNKPVYIVGMMRITVKPLCTLPNWGRRLHIQPR